MTSLIVCQSCGTAVDYDPDAFAATCEACGRRHHPRTGCC